MKICSLTTGDCEFDSRILRTAGSLVKAGHEVHIVAKRAPHLAHEEMVDGIFMHRVGPLLTTGFFDQSLPDMVKFFLPVFTYGNLLNKELSLKAQSLQADIYHANDLDTVVPAFRAARANHVPWIFDSHEIFPEVIKEVVHYQKNWLKKIPSYVAYRYFLWIEGRYIRRANAVVTVGSAIAKYFAKRYNIPEPTVVMNCPDPVPDTPPINYRQKLGLTADARLIMYAGILQENRALDQLVRAMVLLPTTDHLIFIGYGPMTEQLVTIAKEVNVADRVHLLPPVAHDQVAANLRGGDIGVLSVIPGSLSKILTMPNKLFEYMAAGLPIVANDLPSVSAVIREHNIGVIIPDLTPASLAVGMKEALDRPDAAATSQRIAQLFRSSFTWDSQFQKLLRVYESLHHSAKQ